jgi:hypothetical protein
MLSEKPIAPESFVIPCALAKLFGCEAGVLTHSPDHVRLVGKPCLCGKLGPVEIVHLHGFVQLDRELL